MINKHNNTSAHLLTIMIQRISEGMLLVTLFLPLMFLDFLALQDNLATNHISSLNVHWSNAAASTILCWTSSHIFYISLVFRVRSNEHLHLSICKNICDSMGIYMIFYWASSKNVLNFRRVHCKMLSNNVVTGVSFVCDP